MVTRKVRTFGTKTNTFSIDAFIDITRLSHTYECYCSFLISTATANCLLLRNIHVLGNCGSQTFILSSQVHRTVKTIQAAGCSHVFVIHRTPLNSIVAKYTAANYIPSQIKTEYSLNSINSLSFRTYRLPILNLD